MFPRYALAALLPFGCAQQQVAIATELALQCVRSKASDAN
jgi:hypothetical protein